MQFIVSGAAGALLVAAASGVRSVAAQRAPRRRVEAIRAAQDCLTVLGADHRAAEAVATHQQQEAAALAVLSHQVGDTRAAGVSPWLEWIRSVL